MKNENCVEKKLTENYDLPVLSFVENATIFSVVYGVSSNLVLVERLKKLNEILPSICPSGFNCLMIRSAGFFCNKCRGDIDFTIIPKTIPINP